MPDLTPALPPTVKKPQCGHTVWGKVVCNWNAWNKSIQLVSPEMYPVLWASIFKCLAYYYYYSYSYSYSYYYYSKGKMRHLQPLNWPRLWETFEGWSGSVNEVLKVKMQWPCCIRTQGSQLHSQGMARLWLAMCVCVMCLKVAIRTSLNLFSQCLDIDQIHDMIWIDISFSRLGRTWNPSGARVCWEIESMPLSSGLLLLVAFLKCRHHVKKVWKSSMTSK
jgi:hypothetical protein